LLIELLDLYAYLLLVSNHLSRLQGSFDYF